MTFRVGQKVVCIDDTPRPGFIWITHKPTIGKVYEVTGLEWHERYGECIFTDVFPDYALHSARFRLVVERKTNISVFTKMLTDKRVSEST